MNKRACILFAACLASGTPVIALAHESAFDHGIVAGFVHLLSGIDHLVPLIAAGYLAVRLATTAYRRTVSRWTTKGFFRRP